MKDDKYYLELESKGYYDTIDKRSKDYREYKAWKKSKDDFSKLKENVEKQDVGLGDVIEKVAKATGIDKVVKAVAGEDCGCDERKERFNNISLWRKRNVNCIEDKDYEFIKRFVYKTPSRITYEDRTRLINAYNHVFRTNVKNTNCSSCVASYIKNFKQYLDIYDK